MKVYINEEISKNGISNYMFYHGTSNFNLNSLKDLKLKYANAGDYGEGIYLTTDKDYAKRAGLKILHGTIKPNNPLIIGSEDYFDNVYPIISNNGKNHTPQMFQLASIAKKLGYDSIIIERNIDDIWAIILNDNIL